MNALLTIDQAAQHIASGQLIAYPTEAVYGIGCNPADEAAVKAVLDLKARDANKGFIVIASSLNQLDDYMATPTAEERKTITDAWPGPVTFVVKAKAGLSPLLTGDRPTLAVRVSSHPVVQALCLACGHALISTSANISGTPALTSANAVNDAFNGRIAGVVSGALGNLKSATPIFSLSTGEQLR